jgi:oligopeptidase B
MKILSNLNLLAIAFISTFSACQNNETNNQQPMSQLLQKQNIPYPIADKKPEVLSIHGDERIDNYFWMRLSDEQKNADSPDEQTQKVLNYLNAENDYLDTMMSHTKTFQNELFEELKGRIKQDDASVPYYENGYYYFSKYTEGSQYPIYYRKKGNLEAPEEMILNQNELAEGYKYYAIGSWEVSTNNEILAFSEDNVSRRQYTIKFKNLNDGSLFEESIPNTTGGIVWANDNKTVFYTKKDAALRSYKIFKHILGTPVEKDIEIFHEKDDTYDVGIGKTKSGKYLIIETSSKIANEYHILEADNPNGKFTLFNPREDNLEYDISHINDTWYIVTNKDGAKNFKLMSTKIGKTTKDNWMEVIPHRENVHLLGIQLFNDYLVVSERIDGIRKIRIMPWNGEEHYIEFNENVYTSYVSVNTEMNTSILRIEYTSLTTPNSTFDYDMKNKNLTLLKQQEVLGEFDKNDYISERIYATATDGTKIPISLVYHKTFKKDGTQPLLLYGYGSYGYSIDPTFSSSRLSLLNRGFAFAIAHIRGGQEMGRDWYENGKFLNKRNTFTDFIACGEHLVKEKYADSQNLFASGGSAGGLLIGAVMNMKPELWKGVLAAVPFVDVVSTMLDESIPLTTGEFNEWGNPKDSIYYHYMKSYSPYDQVEAKDYPALLVTTGYHDSQVQYWEPAKWVAKLRELKTDKNPLMMYCDMHTGHGGASGRFDNLKKTAMEYAFFIDLAQYQKN